MAKKKFSQLPAAETLTGGELTAISQSISTVLTSVQSTIDDVGAFFTSSTTFVTNLANNNTFVSALVDNDTFITELTSDETFITELTSNETFISTIITEVVAEDVWVDTTGDRMTGTLEFQHPSASDEFVIQPTADGDLNISPTNLNDNLYLAVSNADPAILAADRQGSVVAGKFRCAIPVSDGVADGTLMTSNVDASALNIYLGASAGTFTIRKNTGAGGLDFFLGNYFSVSQGNTGSITLVPETADVHLLIPAGYIASPRDQYSVITATLISASVTQEPLTYNEEYWLISGDMAEAP